jgi:hypothetical protein
MTDTAPRKNMRLTYGWQNLPWLSSPHSKGSLQDWRIVACCLFSPRHAGTKIPTVIALGNIIRKRMSDDASSWVTGKAPRQRERKFCSKMPGWATQQRS